MSEVDEHPLTILCVDDERIILTSLKEQLRNALGDVSVETAESGEEGLEVIQELQETGALLPLVISDQLMPGMRGEEFLEAVHALAPDTLKVLLTGQATAEAVGAVVNRAGLYRYIGKPWSEDDLVLTVRQAVRAWLGERDLRRKDMELRETHEALLRFVPQEFLALLERERLADVALGDATQRSMMVVFADIMGYSRLTSELGARKAFDVLNEFVRTLDAVFREAGGFISGLEGDGVLALFPGSAEDAVSASVEAHHALRRLADEPGLGMGLAVHAGDLVLGAVGSPDRLKCDVVGDAVNFCARLEGLTRELDAAAGVRGCRRAPRRSLHAEEFALRSLERSER